MAMRSGRLFPLRSNFRNLRYPNNEAQSYTPVDVLPRDGMQAR